SGKPVVQIKNQYHELDHKGGLSPAIKKEQVDFKALSFDHPFYYGETGDFDLVPYSEYVDIYVETILETVTEEETAPTPAESETVAVSDPSGTEPAETDGTATEAVIEPAETEGTTTEAVIEPAVTETAATEPVTDPETEPVTFVVTDAVTVAYEPAMADGAAPAEETGSTPSDPPAEESDNLPNDKPNVVLPDGVIEKNGKYYTVKTRLMYGFRNGEGKTVIKAQYASVMPFSPEGLACVTDFEGSVFYIDTAGKETVTLRKDVYIYPPEFDYVRLRQFLLSPLNKNAESLGAYYFDHGYTMVRYCITGGYSMSKLYASEHRLVNTKGEFFTLPDGYSLMSYSDGILLLEREGRYGCMNIDGAWIKPAVYLDAKPFLQGLAAFCNESGKWGLLDRNGNEILPFAFDYLSPVSGGRVAAFSAERGWEIYGVMDKT
ncbi:MAG: WG repeat-containing protein, partial [Clostridia bacterium]|nr:WG repeat-containing protein [Clostridia bacterium]